MRVICAYASDLEFNPHSLGHGRYRPAMGLLEDICPEVERFPMRTGQDTAYFELFERLFAEKAHFLNVEHDVEIRLDVIESLANCPNPWCVFPYQGPCEGELLYESLGCTRFRTADLPEGMFEEIKSMVNDGRDAKDWRRLDVNLSARLRFHGFEPCLHSEVKHEHMYSWGCACGKSHT